MCNPAPLWSSVNNLSNGASFLQLHLAVTAGVADAQQDSLPALTLHIPSREPHPILFD